MQKQREWPKEKLEEGLVGFAAIERHQSFQIRIPRPSVFSHCRGGKRLLFRVFDCGCLRRINGFRVRVIVSEKVQVQRMCSPISRLGDEEEHKEKAESHENGKEEEL